MYRGETTTTIISGFPVPVNNIRDVFITFSSRGHSIIEKTIEDCTVGETSISFELTQQESLQLKTGDVSRSIIVITIDGKRFESDPSPIPVFQTSKDGVL